MKDSKSLTRFLFGESQTESQIDETFADIWEQLDLDSDVAEPKNRRPLKKALKELGVSCCKEDSLNDENGMTCLVLGCADDYSSALATLSEPDSLEKLTDMGWVHNPCGEFTQEGEDPKFKIEFIEICCDDPTDSDTPGASEAEIMKAAIDMSDKNSGEYHSTVESIARRLIEDEVDDAEAIEAEQEEEDRKDALRNHPTKGVDKARVRNHASTHSDAPR